MYGAEAKYLVAQTYFDEGETAKAEKEVLEYIEVSTPHAYWLARSFVLLSDVEQMVHAAERFPVNPPRNKEEYYYRSIFEEHFPSESAAKSVPSVPSVACSTAEALAWDKAFQHINEPSGRAVTDVHEEGYKN